MKKIFTLIVMLFLAMSSAWSYDRMLAESYADFFQPFSGKAIGKSLHMMKTSDFISEVKNGSVVVLDVRTQGETGIYGITIPGSLTISMDEVFLPENLDRLPTDKNIVVVCKAGHRAFAIATALRHIGFSNAYSLKLGMEDLAIYISPATAY